MFHCFSTNCILELQCDFENIDIAGHTVITSYTCGYTFDETTGEEEVERKVYNTDLADMKFQFTATEVVLAD